MEEKNEFQSYEDIISYVDACKYLNINPIYEELLLYVGIKKSHIALIKLETIIEAINKIEGFVIDWDNFKQRKWLGWFYLDSPFQFGGSDCRSTCAYAEVGCTSRLHLPTEEITEYVTKQFLDLWKEYMINE